MTDPQKFSTAPSLKEKPIKNDSPSSNSAKPNKSTKSEAVSCVPLLSCASSRWISEPHDNDITFQKNYKLCGQHSGNAKFLALIAFNEMVYHRCSEKHKVLLSRSIIDAFARQEPPGRFLVYNEDQGMWFEMERKKALGTVGATLRYFFRDRYAPRETEGEKD